MPKQLKEIPKEFPVELAPKRWSLQIQRVPTNNEEVNYDKMNEVLFCSLDDLDMLIIQQNDVMEELLDDSFFSDELKKIRQQFVEECWGKQTKKPKGFKEEN